MAEERPATMMCRSVLVCIAFVCGLVPAGGPATASTGGSITPGAPVISTTRNLTSRYRIPLEPRGDLLVGGSSHERITRVVLYAPGSKGGTLVLRVLERPDGVCSLYLTGPSELTSKIVRGSIYVRAVSQELALFEPLDGAWVRIPAEVVHAAPGDGIRSPEEYILAYQISNLGAYWLIPTGPPRVSVESVIAESPSSRTLMGGGLSNALLPLLGASLLLTTAWVMSVATHYLQRRG